MVGNGWINPSTVLTGITQGFPLLNGVGFVLRAHTPVVDGGTSSKFTWKASVQYDVAPDSLLYATYETGYRAGGFQLAESYPTYKPEFLDAASIGSKNRFLDGRLQVNGEIFWWKYKDQQINFFTLSPQGTLVSSTQNVGSSTNKGLDIDVIFAATDNTRLSARYNYLKATYDDLHFITAPPRQFRLPVHVHRWHRWRRSGKGLRLLGQAGDVRAGAHLQRRHRADLPDGRLRPRRLGALHLARRAVELDRVRRARADSLLLGHRCLAHAACAGRPLVGERLRAQPRGRTAPPVGPDARHRCGHGVLRRGRDLRTARAGRILTPRV
jgi:hypothetical protein